MTKNLHSYIDICIVTTEASKSHLTALLRTDLNSTVVTTEEPVRRNMLIF